MERVKIMIHYKDNITGQVYGFESDGSQNHLIKSHYVLMTDQEFAEFQEEQQQKLQEKIAALNNVDPTIKLQQFLTSNPDVAALINQQP